MYDFNSGGCLYTHPVSYCGPNIKLKCSELCHTVMLLYAGNCATGMIARNAMELTGAKLNLHSHHFALLDLEIFICLFGTLFSLKFLIIHCDFQTIIFFKIFDYTL